MRPIEIEIWANRVLDSMGKAGMTEDHRVELKREWIEGHTAARRLAGHANSAPDDDILWLIGVDEKAAKVVGAQWQELATWWKKIEVEFADHIAPEMKAISMERDGIPLVAIAFRTDRAPYLVRNEEFGRLRGQDMAFEVPFRVGTEVRTATRGQLLTLLSSSLDLPRHELVSAAVALYKPVRKERWMQRCVVDAQFYLVAINNNTIAFDQRACEVTVEAAPLLPPTTLEVPQLSLVGKASIFDGHNFRITGTELLHLKVEGEVPSIGNQLVEQAHLVITLRPIGFERKISFDCTLNLEPSNSVSGVTHSFVQRGMLAK